MSSIGYTYKPFSIIGPVDLTSYLFDVVYRMVAEGTGMEEREVHEAYKSRFNLRHRFQKRNGKIVLLPANGSDTSTASLETWEYIMKTRADAEIELSIIIPMPSEVFDNDTK